MVACCKMEAKWVRRIFKLKDYSELKATCVQVCNDNFWESVHKVAYLLCSFKPDMWRNMHRFAAGLDQTCDQYTSWSISLVTSLLNSCVPWAPILRKSKVHEENGSSIQINSPYIYAINLNPCAKLWV